MHRREKLTHNREKGRELNNHGTDEELKTIVCFKCVPYSESIQIRGDRSLDFSNVSWEIGQYDLNAVELGVNLTATNGGECIVMTANGDVVSNSKMQKAILSRGANEMYGIENESLANADSYQCAKALAAGIKKLGDVDLVVCGEGSGDCYAQQVGNILGGLLGWTTVNAVSAANIEDGVLKLERSTESSVEMLEVSLPAVISVTSDINTPRIPTMKDILGAGKKPKTIWSAADVELESPATSQVLSLAAPAQADRKKVILDAADDTAIAQFAAELKNAMK